ncbi:PIN domain-containing protein [Streptomyces sp. NPDC086776]|uniref:PIN domain-containing protein n=1 Tax=Streptomyces sp. NPDC086776 TaxID=3365756 RepID=UPI003813EE27
MIILDSNILKGISLRGPDAELLRTIRTSGVQRVAAPWIVIEEIAAQQALLYEEKYQAAASAMDTLDRATPWTSVPAPRKADPERVRSHWRGRYGEVAETLRTSPTAYEQALFREANLLAPCKTVNSGRHKTGARDAAIWLTAVEYAQEHQEETVYFVSNNTEDFGDGTSFRPPLDADLKGLDGRFVLFTSLGGVLTKFATEADAPEDEVKTHLAAEGSRRSIAHAARRYARRKPNFTGTVIGGGSGQMAEVQVKAWQDMPEAVLSSVRDIRAHEIAGHKWCTATARWLIYGHTRPGRDAVEGVVNASWETRVLLSPTAPGEEVTILRTNQFGPLMLGDVADLPKDDRLANGAEAPPKTGVLRDVQSWWSATPAVDQQLVLEALKHLPVTKTNLSYAKSLMEQLHQRQTEEAERRLRDALDDLHEEEPDEPVDE